MKKTYLVLSAVLMCLCTFTAKAQDFANPVEEKLEFFKKHLHIENDTMEKVLQLYYDIESLLFALNEELRAEQEIIFQDTAFLKNLSEKEATDILERGWVFDERKFRAKREFEQQLLEFIGAKNLLKLQKAEKLFLETTQTNEHIFTN